VRRSAPGSLASVPSPRPTSVAAVALGEVAALVDAPVPTAEPRPDSAEPRTSEGPEGVRLRGVSLDSRTVQPGDLYAALLSAFTRAFERWHAPAA